MNLRAWLALMCCAAALAAFGATARAAAEGPLLAAHPDGRKPAATAPATRPARGAPSPEELDDLLSVLREFNPDRADAIARIRNQQPERIRELLGDYGPTLKGLIDIRKRDPDLFKLHIEDLRLGARSLEAVRRLQEALAAPDPAKAQERRKALEGYVLLHFDVRQKLREQDLKALQRRLDDFRKDIEAQAKARDQFIARRAKEVAASGEVRSTPKAVSTAPRTPAKPLSPDEQGNLLAVLRDINPERAAAIDEIRKRNPERVSELLQDYVGPLRHFANQRQRDPELYKLSVLDFKVNTQLAAAAAQYQDAQKAGDRAKADTARKQLETLVGQQFDVRQKRRERELKLLEARIKDFRQELEARLAARDDLIKKRLRDLLPRADGEKQPEW